MTEIWREIERLETERQTNRQTEREARRRRKKHRVKVLGEIKQPVSKVHNNITRCA